MTYTTTEKTYTLQHMCAMCAIQPIIPHYMSNNSHIKKPVTGHNGRFFKKSSINSVKFSTTGITLQKKLTLK
jgi:hypothetical protein